VRDARLDRVGMFQTGCGDPIKSVALKSLARFDEATVNQTFKCLMCLVLGHVHREPYFRGIRCIF
jgi:hypothetical protein